MVSRIIAKEFSAKRETGQHALNLKVFSVSMRGQFIASFNCKIEHSFESQGLSSSHCNDIHHYTT